MLATQLAELLDGSPDGVDAALDLVNGLDDGLTHGLARLGEDRTAALAALAGAVAGTPIGDRVSEAVEKIAAGAISEEYVTALAGARTALLGAVHDALLDRLDTALGRTRAGWEAAAPATAALSTMDNLLAGCRSWLNELAITGWRGVDHDIVSASGQTLEAVLAEPGLRRLAVLLDGLAAELRASCPVATMELLPARRWADLWARALLLSQDAGDRPAGGEPAVVSGRLLPLGVDVHEHATAGQVQLHGILEPAGGAAPRLVRTSVAVAKVDTIVGLALWQLFKEYPILLGALAEHRSVELTDVSLMDSGDLVWREDLARPGEPVDPFATARLQLSGALAPAVPPLDRHPVRIGEPVLLESYTATAGEDGSVTLELVGSSLAVDVDRLPSCGPLTPALVAGSSACLGLIRWDAGRWLVQPLAVQSTVKKKITTVHNGGLALDPKSAKAGAAVTTLHERAGRLLRK